MKEQFFSESSTVEKSDSQERATCVAHINQLLATDMDPEEQKNKIYETIKSLSQKTFDDPNIEGYGSTLNYSSTTYFLNLGNGSYVSFDRHTDGGAIEASIMNVEILPEKRKLEVQEMLKLLGTLDDRATSAHSASEKKNCAADIALLRQRLADLEYYWQHEKEVKVPLPPKYQGIDD